MPHDPNQDLSRLAEFLTQAAPDLGLSPSDVPIDAILGLSSDVARSVMRPGVPVTAYAVGLAVGRGMTLEEALHTTQQQLAQFVATHGCDPSRILTRAPGHH